MPRVPTTTSALGRGPEPLVERPGLVRLPVPEADPAQPLMSHDPGQRLGNRAEDLTQAGVEQQGLVSDDEELVEREAPGDGVGIGRQAVDAIGDLVNVGLHENDTSGVK